MITSNWRVGVFPGDAMVARTGTTLLVARPTSAAHDVFLSALLDVLEQGGAAGDRDASPLTRQVTALVARTPASDVPSFGVAVIDGTTVSVVMSGLVALEADYGGGRRESASGKDATTVVDRVVSRADFVSVALLGATAADPRSDLGGGVVPGDGFLISNRLPLGAAAPGPRAQDPAPPLPRFTPDRDATPASPDAIADLVATSVAADGTPFEIVSLTPPRRPGDDSAVLPDPVHDDDVPQGSAEVDGIMCARNHFNDPAALYCAQCGIAMVQRTHVAVRGTRPPLGVLVGDDGAVYAVTESYVLGRSPEQDAAVLAGTARPLVLSDPEGLLSRAHARLLVDGWTAYLEDAGSVNGTYVRESDDVPWTRMSPNERRALTIGTRIKVGSRSFVYESHRRS